MHPQWMYWTHRNAQALHYALHNKRIRQQAKNAASEQGLLKGTKSKKDEETVLRQIVAQNLDLRGGFAPPKVTDILWVRLVMIPYTLACYLWWLADWYYRINYQGQELTDDDREYLILRNLGWNADRWECEEEETKDKMVRFQVHEHVMSLSISLPLFQGALRSGRVLSRLTPAVLLFLSYPFFLLARSGKPKFGIP